VLLQEVGDQPGGGKQRTQQRRLRLALQIRTGRHTLKTAADGRQVRAVRAAVCEALALPRQRHPHADASTCAKPHTGMQPQPSSAAENCQ
jgi:hypothetical protein